MNRYTPSPPPTGVDEVTARWLEDQFRQVADALNDLLLAKEVMAQPPARPLEGMIAMADGTNWNPGEGAGAYEYINGQWKKL